MPGDFASDTFASPRVLSNELPFMTAATPLTPHTIFLSYSAAIGGPAPGPAFNSLARGTRVAAAPQPTPSGRPRQPQRLTSYPPPAGVDPLSPAGDRPGCTADLQTAGKPVLDALRAYVTAHESGAPPPPPIPNVNVVAHKAADAELGYYLELRANLPRPPGAQGNGDVQGARAPRAHGPGGGGAGGPVAASPARSRAERRRPAGTIKALKAPTMRPSVARFKPTPIYRECAPIAASPAART